MPARSLRTAVARLSALMLLGLAAPVAAETGPYPGLAPPGDCAEPLKGLSTARPWHPGAVYQTTSDVDAGPPGIQLVSAVGEVRAAGPAGAPRVLECGDTLASGVRVATGSASSAGLMVGSVLVQLDAESAVTVSTTPDGDTDVKLAEGGARVIDPRDAGAPVRVAAVGFESDVRGDAELRIEDGEAVMRTGAATIMALGGSCEPGPPITPLAHLEPLPIVSAPRQGPRLPDPPQEPRRSPCDVPGSGCTGRDAMDGAPVIVEQPPTMDPFPGGN